MFKMKEALRKMSISPYVQRKNSSPAAFIKQNNGEMQHLNDSFNRKKSAQQLAALSLTDLTREEELDFNPTVYRKFSYIDIINLREASSGYKQKSKNIIESLSLDAKAVELSALISAGTTDKQNIRKRFSIANKDCTKSSKIVTRRKSIEVLLKNQPKKKIRRKKTSSYEPHQLLEKAILEGYDDIVKGIISTGQVNVNKLNGSGYAPLHLAAMTESSSHMINILLELGAYVNIPDVTGFTPLEVAVHEGCFECAQILIGKGADQTFIMHGRLDSKVNIYDQ